MKANLAKSPIKLWSTTISLASAVLISGFFNSPARAHALNVRAVRQSFSWERYKVADEGFTVELPTVPALTTYNVPKEPTAKSPLINVIGAYSQGVVYVIQVFGRKQSLENFIVSERGAAASIKSQVNIGGVQGVEVAFQNETSLGRTQYFITDRRIYIFRAQAAPLGNPEIGINEFFGSIKFDKELSARPIAEGPGEPAAEGINGATDQSNAEVFTSKQVERRAQVITKPNPAYTKEARMHRTTGAVVLKCLFSSKGTVEKIEVVKELPDGLTEKAIAAALQIKFIPPIKDGHFVSTYLQLEYNFNLY